MPEDVSLAARLVLAPRATRLPAPPPQERKAAEQPHTDDTPADPREAAPPEDRRAPNPPGDPAQETASQDPVIEKTPADDQKRDTGQSMEELVLAAAQAAIPADLLAQLAAVPATSRVGPSGRSGAVRTSGARGRPVGVRPGEPRGGTRLNVVETLRAAAPWQRLRRGAEPVPDAGRIAVRREDFRITRYEQRSETTIIFVVDASRSSAVNRLAEAKGAVEMLLADCYARRDRVAVIAFRGREAELLLPPTRSLVRAKRQLAGLPGGGGTPLAAGLAAAHRLAEAARRRGETPTVVLLTDGRANVALDGSAGRERAEGEAIVAGRKLRAAGITSLLVDTAQRPQAAAQRFAVEMGARYVPLPYANPTSLSKTVRVETGSAKAGRATTEPSQRRPR